MFNEAIYTALKTEFGLHLLDECASHWDELPCCTIRALRCWW